MKIVLDGIQMDNTAETTGGISDGRSVAKINTLDKRNIASFDSPGSRGSAHNDLGRAAVEVSFNGTIWGESAKEVIEQIRGKFKSGEPVPFIANLSGMTDITRVVIERLDISDMPGFKDRYDYSIRLKEYREPPEEPTLPAVGGAEAGEGGEGAGEEEGEAGKEEGEEGDGADEEAKAWADEEAEKSDEGSNVVIGKVLNADGKPKKGATVKVSSDSGERTVVTDDEGTYLLENLEPGEYTAIVDGENDFEGIKKKLIVGNGDKGESEGESEG
jgi:hypothetical protein